MASDPTPNERRTALLMMAREHREESARAGKPMSHVVHVSRGDRDVAILFAFDIQPLVAAAEVIITAAHADSVALINDTWGRLPPARKLNPLTGRPLPGEMTDEEFNTYVTINPITGERWKSGEMQKLVDQGLKEKAGLREFLMVMYFARPNVPSAGTPWQWMMPYDTRGREIVWEKSLDQGEARMTGWIYRAFMAAFRNPDILKKIHEHPVGAMLAEGLSTESQQAHLDAAALKYGLARTKPGDVMGMVPIYEDDHPDRKAVLDKSLEPEQLQKDVRSWHARLRAEAN